MAGARRAAPFQADWRKALDVFIAIVEGISGPKLAAKLRDTENRLPQSWYDAGYELIEAGLLVLVSAFVRFAATHPLGLARRRGEEHVRFVAGADFDQRVVVKVNAVERLSGTLGAGPISRLFVRTLRVHKGDNEDWAEAWLRYASKVRAGGRVVVTATDSAAMAIGS